MRQRPRTLSRPVGPRNVESRSVDSRKPVVFAALAAFLALGLTGGCARKEQPKPAEGPSALPLQTFARQWATDLKLRNDPVRTLHVREQSVYVYTRRGRVAALARDTGAIRYTFPVKNGRDKLFAPVVMNDPVTISMQVPTLDTKQTTRVLSMTASAVVFPTTSTMEVYDRDTGKFIDSVDLPFALTSNAVGSAGMAYVGGAVRASARASAVDITQPYVPVKWQLMVPGVGITAGPALWQDAVFIGAEDGSVTAVTTAGREPIWPLPGGVFKTGSAIVGDLSVDDECVYASSTDTKLYALNRNNGRIRWTYHSGATLRAGAAVTSDMVYQFAPGRGLVAIDKKAGKFNRDPLWVAEDATQFLAQDDRNAYVRRRDNAIVARDKRTGEVKFTSRRRDLDVFGTNTLSEDGIVFAATKEGRVIAVRPILRPGVIGEMVEVDLTPVE